MAQSFDSSVFNGGIQVYGNAYVTGQLEVGSGEVLGVVSLKNNNSSVTVNPNETISIKTNNTEIFTLSQNNVVFSTTGIIQQLFETVNISSTALTGTVNLDILSGTLFYYTADASADWVFNIRGNSNISLNSILPIQKSVTITMLCTQGVTARYPTSFRIDNTPITVKWIEGIAPTSGFANSINVYTYSIFKTADSTFTVLASQSRFS